MTNHLTPDEINDLLIDQEGNARVLAHLRECVACGAAVAELRKALGDFNEFADRWAQREAKQSVPVPTPWAVRISSWPRLMPALSSAFLACLSASLWVALSVARHQPSSALQPATSKATEIQQDNRWLLAMDQDLQGDPYSIVTPVPGSETSPRPQPSVSHRRRP